ncbi:MAG: alpha/beta fold hydrolase, partial [Myxococcota bacterium]|nr:alpha/beta fold hydrolase [Myxococcota bacterium]
MGDLDCHYVRVGPGHDRSIPVVLVHGFLMSSFSWRHNISSISEEREVIAPCQLGAGWSQIAGDGYDLNGLSDFLLGLLRRLGISEAHLVGHSLGGAVATWMAHRAPHIFRRLVLVNPLVSPRLVPPHPKWLHQSWVSPVLR